MPDSHIKCGTKETATPVSTLPNLTECCQNITVCVLPGELKPVKKIPEFCVEAALYCRRATLEESLPLTEKQHRVKYVTLR